MSDPSAGEEAELQPREAMLQMPGGKARSLYLALREEVASGVRPAGSMLPGEQRLAESFGVSRVTVRRALDALERDGLIDRRPGAGTTVRDAASSEPARALGLAADGRVQTAIRVRLLDGQPFSHLTTHVPEEVAAGYTEADLATTPLFRLLERSGVRLAGAEQQVTAALAGPEIAEALSVPVGSPLLSIRRIVREQGGRGVEYLGALYRCDLFRLEMSLARVGSGESARWEPVLDGKCLSGESG